MLLLLLPLLLVHITVTIFMLGRLYWWLDICQAHQLTNSPAAGAYYGDNFVDYINWLFERCQAHQILPDPFQIRTSIVGLYVDSYDE